MKTINLSKLEGVWESVHLDVSVIIYHHYSGNYHIMIVHMNEHTKQAQPSVYEIYEEEDGYYFGLSVNRQKLEYAPSDDMLILSKYGNYNRN